jgi:UDP:flavonoid glycosyltransferase YjiC (YdhE family)
MRVLFVTMDGGGNLPPAIGIAHEVVRRGGTARFLGNAVQRAAIEHAGLRFEPFREGRDYDSSLPRSTVSGVRELTGLFADRGIGRDAIASISADPVDAVVVDCLLWGAALELSPCEVPIVSLVHSQWQYFRSNARGPVGLISRLRGANPVRAEQTAALTLVTTRSDIEEPSGTASPTSVVHTGFVWQGSPVVAQPAAHRPIVLVSFSTTSFPGQARALQNVLDALDGLDVNVVATTGAVDPSSLRVPPNARVERRIDHSEVLPATRLVIGHGGHATTARALAHGIPLLVMPMHPLMDQPAIGRSVTRLGVGRSIPKSSSVAAIREAVVALLDDDATYERAIRLGEDVRAVDGAAAAADALELVVARST